MGALIVFLTLAAVAAVGFTGGWWLRGLRDTYRAEAAKFGERDEP